MLQESVTYEVYDKPAEAFDARLGSDQREIRRTKEEGVQLKA